MSEPREDDDAPNNLRPGQYDEGGHGGMATRELEAEEQARARAEEGAGAPGGARAGQEAEQPGE